MGLYNRDYNLDVRRGLVPGVSLVTVIGHSNDVRTTSETLMPGLVTIAPDALFLTPATVTVSSTDANDTSAGTGLRTLLLSGLDASGNPQSETITMNGTTGVVSANTYSWIQSMVALTAGTSLVNFGTLYAGTGTVTAGIPAVRLCSMESGANNSTTAAYMVPTGKIFHAEQLTISLGDSTKTMVVDIYIRNVTTGLYLKAVEYNIPAGFQLQPIIAFTGLVAGTIVDVRVNTDAGTGASATVALAGYLVNT